MLRSDFHCVVVDDIIIFFIIFLYCCGFFFFLILRSLRVFVYRVMLTFFLLTLLPFQVFLDLDLVFFLLFGLLALCMILENFCFEMRFLASLGPNLFVIRQELILSVSALGSIDFLNIGLLGEGFLVLNVKGWVDLLLDKCKGFLVLFFRIFMAVVKVYRC